MELPESKNKVNIIYATETGTSYDLTKQFLLTEGLKITINNFINIAQIDSFDSHKDDGLWIFFISTTGQGDFPYTMRTLWKKMLNKYHGPLNWMKFTIFSLGDRSYGDNFCMAARKFRQRLIGLGAQEAVQIGLGDEQQGNGYFTEYRQVWLPRLNEYFETNNYLLPLQQQQKQHNSLSTRMKQLNFKDLSLCDKEYDLRLLQREEVCTNKDRRVFTTVFEVVDYPEQVQFGDVLSIYPHNNPQHVSYLMKYFNLNQHDVYSVDLNNLNNNKELIQNNQQQVNKSIPYKQLFSSSLNISSTLNHSFFISRQDIPPLNKYCQNQMFKQKLTQLQKDYDEYHNYIKKYKRNVIEVLRDFQITNLPVNEFILRCSQIFPRKYSIAQVISNGDKKIVKILFKLVKTNINEIRIHQGLCSHDLALWTNMGSYRKGTILKGEFQYKQRQVNNMIFMTLGTGVAPFMQYFDLALKSTNQWNFTLFFTNRYQNQTYFQSHLQRLTQKNQLNPFLSFTGQGGKRIIRLVEDNCEHIREVIDKNGLESIRFMICGPKEVCEGLENILSRELGIDIKVLKKKRLFVYQNW